MAFKPGTESVKAARDFTADTLRAWHLDGLIEDAIIIASELVTNAIRHGSLLAGQEDPPEVELAWQRFASRVTCVVTDGSSRPPVLGPADMSAESGRGLQVVHALAAAWGWMMINTREKAVWATLLLPPPGSLLPPAFDPGMPLSMACRRVITPA
ncbi:MAG TPA: ATP-binding protein [Streptosporangiaceae bacterium]